MTRAHPPRKKPRPAATTNRPKLSQRGLARLAADLAQVQTDLPQLVSQDEWEQLLPWYVSDELSGENVRALYPRLWQHLQTCTRCAESYALLKLALEEDTGAAIPREARPTLPFEFTPADSAWFQQKSSQLLGDKPRVNFILNPTHLKKLFAAPQFSSLRDAGDQPARALLLQDEMSIGDQTMVVQAWLISSAGSRNVNVQLQIVPLTPLRAPLEAYLRWGASEYRTRITQGAGAFENIPWREVLAASATPPTPHFRLSFQLISE